MPGHWNLDSHILEWPPFCSEARLTRTLGVLCSATESHPFCNTQITFLFTMESLSAVHGVTAVTDSS